MSILSLPHSPGPRPPAHRRGPALALIVALHAAVGWGLLHQTPWRPLPPAPEPLMVVLMAAPRPALQETLAPLAPLPRPPSPSPPPQAVTMPVPLPDQVPEPAPAVPSTVRAPSPAAALSTPDPAPTAAAADALSTSQAPTAQPQPAPAPAHIPPAAIQYRVLPAVDYPPASRRLGEAGLVIVAVWVDEAGDPRELQIVQSSGHDRLDRAALAGVRRARFLPWMVDGHSRAGWARIPIPFELER